MYEEFHTRACQADITVRITFSPLPVKSGEAVPAGYAREFYRAGDEERLYSSYYTPDGFVDYSCRIIKDDYIELFIDFDGGLWDSMVFNALNIPELLAARGIFLCHSSYIIHRGEAVLFISGKGGGKSTQASLWQKERNAEIINGDRSLLKFEGDRLMACGTPYCGSSKTALNRTAPVRALILLGKGSENIIERVSGIQALTGIVSQLSREHYQNLSACEFAEKICRTAPVYSMKCLPDPSAVQALEDVLWET